MQERSFVSEFVADVCFGINRGYSLSFENRVQKSRRRDDDTLSNIASARTIAYYSYLQSPVISAQKRKGHYQ
jgi:hypothetical protein